MPDKIRTFQMMIHVSLGLGALAAALQVGRLADEGNSGFVIVVQLASMIALGFFTHLITHHGGGWSRWACAILWCVGLPFLMMAATLAFRADMIIGGLLGTQMLVQAAAIAMLFTEEAGNWFEA